MSILKYAFFTFLLLLFSCRGTQSVKQEPTPDNKPSKDTLAVELKSEDSSNIDSVSNPSNKAPNTKPLTQVKQVREFNDIARLLAGLKQTDGSAYDSFQKWDSWQKYSAYINSTWSSVQKKRLAPMNKWGATELANINEAKRDIFYPFSGADFMSVFTLYPNASTYTMLALERPGDFPNLSNTNQEQFGGYLNAIKNALTDIFQRSFFVTRHMQTDLMKQNVNGTLPLLSFFMVRTGNKILNIERVRINSLGNVVSIPNDSANYGNNRGIKISFVSAKSQEVKTLYYFSLNLQDDYLKSNKGMLTYLGNFKEVDSYLKSASYLLHYPNFSIIRNILLNKSANILQDDSGIGYHYYKKDIWNIQLYGSYEKPINQFKNRLQLDLKNDYKDSTKVKPLPFVTGYHWGTKEPNLQLATKKVK